MEINRTSFVLYTSCKSQVEELTHEQAGILFKALLDYETGGECTEELLQLDGMARVIFRGMQSYLDSDYEAYLKVCEKNRENGKKGGRPKKPKETQVNPKNPTGYFGNPKNLDIDIDIDSDIDSVIEDREKEKKPTRHKYGEYRNVLLTDQEYEKLEKEFPDLNERIERLSEYKESSGKKYKSDFATIRRWAKTDNKQTDSKEKEISEQRKEYINWCSIE